MSWISRESFSHIYKELHKTLTLARKYQVDWIYNRLSQHIRDQWPTTLEEWHAFHSNIKSKEELREIGLAATPTHYSVPNASHAIRLGTEFDIPQVLPAAFYMLAITDVHSDPDAADFAFTDIAAEWDVLERSDLLRLFRGKDRLIKKHALIARAYCSSKWCRASSGPDSCSKKLLSLRQEHEQSFDMEFARRPDILGKLFGLLTTPTDEWPVCSSCTSAIEDDLQELARVVWHELPEIFELNSAP